MNKYEKVEHLNALEDYHVRQLLKRLGFVEGLTLTEEDLDNRLHLHRALQGVPQDDFGHQHIKMLIWNSNVLERKTVFYFKKKEQIVKNSKRGNNR